MGEQPPRVRAGGPQDNSVSPGLMSLSTRGFPAHSYCSFTEGAVCSRISFSVLKWKILVTRARLDPPAVKSEMKCE